MATTQTASETFRVLKGEPENNRCADCNGPDPQWASVSHGIFICLTCAGIHRSMGVHISFVRSLTLDSWSGKQLKLMVCGGNSELSDWFKKYNLPEDSTPDFKYKTVAAKYFRDRLKAKAEEVDFDVPEPAIDDGLNICEEYIPKAAPVAPPPQQAVAPPQEEQKSSGGWGFSFGGMLSSAASMANNAYEKANEIANSEGVKNLTSKVTTTAAAAYDKVGATANAVIESETFQTVKTKTTSIASDAYELAGDTYKKVSENETVQKIKEGTIENINKLEKAAKDKVKSVTGRNTPPEYQ